MRKPPYRIPAMGEIRVVPYNGLNVVSTFTGAGGSCLGFRMAGFRAIWASEFIAEAAEVYRLNFPDVLVNDSDIREVSATQILDEVGLRPGDVDVLEGSPPCSSFSTAGRGFEHWGEIVSYSSTKQRTDDLFFEFARILDGLKPRAFVAENVSGLVKGNGKAYFNVIFRLLRDAGYYVKATVLNAQYHGVPQSRERLFFVGIRSDLEIEPQLPRPLPYIYTVMDAWRDVPDGEKKYFTETKLMSLWSELMPGQGHPKLGWLKRLAWDKPANTICQTWSVGTAAVTHPSTPRYPTIPELKRLQGFPDDFELTGTYAQQWERLARAVPPPLMRQVAGCLVPILEGGGAH